MDKHLSETGHRIAYGNLNEVAVTSQDSMSYAPSSNSSTYDETGTGVESSSNYDNSVIP